MPHIQLNGLVPSIIITRLDRIQAETVLMQRDGGNFRFGGTISGEVDNETYNRRRTAEFEGGYLIRTSCTRFADLPYPLYVSTAGTILDVWREPRVYLYKEPSVILTLDMVDGVVVLHDKGYTPLSTLACAGEFYAIKDSAQKEPKARVGAKEMDFYKCQMVFDGEFSSSRGLAGEFMKLDGLFKIKPRRGRATRNDGRPYGLRGDQEFVLDGHVEAEATASIVRRNGIATPSYVRFSAEGELVL